MTRASFVGFVALTLMAVADGWAQIATPAPLPKAALAASPLANPARAKDHVEIRAASQSFATAFQTGDAKALTALFTDEGEYQDEGSKPIRGRDALAKQYSEFFAKRKEIKATSKTDAIRFLGPDTAIEEGTFTVTVKDTPPSASRFSALYVRQADKWLIALLKEWPDQASSQANLENLAWLIGTWKARVPKRPPRRLIAGSPTKHSSAPSFRSLPRKRATNQPPVCRSSASIRP
jgi:uncharacterized protein (TIGR02246 family)